jgi:hypothetical protein
MLLPAVRHSSHHFRRARSEQTGVRRLGGRRGHVGESAAMVLDRVRCRRHFAGPSVLVCQPDATRAWVSLRVKAILFKLPKLKWVAIGAAAGGASLLLFFFPPGEYSFYPRCVLHTLTGLQCPGCGGLRAAHQLLHGHWAAAFHCNPFLVSMLPILILWATAYGANLAAGRDGLRWFRHPVWLWVWFTAAIAFGIARNLV